MKSIRAVAGLTFFLSSALLGMSAQASFHLWEIQEVYTNFDGSVQFIELATTFSSQNFVNGQQIQTFADGLPDNTFTFNSNISGSTQNKTLLIATPGFGALPGGVTPNYTLPDPNMLGPFFDPGATSIGINFIGADSITFAGASLPTNGADSLYFTPAGLTSTGVNTPQNFAGTDGSVNLPPPAPTGDYNGNGVVDAADYVDWRKTLNQPAVPAGSGADGDADGTIDPGDYDFWAERFGNVVAGAGRGAVNSAVPEPSSALLLLCGLLAFFLPRGARQAG
ncbi:MAG: hypothetical protein WD738_11195 [Pirellulales bacterium]